MIPFNKGIKKIIDQKVLNNWYCLRSIFWNQILSSLNQYSFGIKNLKEFIYNMLENQILIFWMKEWLLKNARNSLKFLLVREHNCMKKIDILLKKTLVNL